MRYSLEKDAETALYLLTKYFNIGTDYGKPVLLHSVRTGFYLLKNKYSREIVLGGFLHDILEDTDIPEIVIADNFGAEVLAIVKANTKDKSIKDSSQRREELIKRCVGAGKNALLVKCADILDNFEYYSELKNEDGIKYCINNAQLIKKLLNEDYDDQTITKVFNLNSI